MADMFNRLQPPPGLEEMLMKALGIPSIVRTGDAIRTGEALGGDSWVEMFGNQAAPNMQATPEQMQEQYRQQLLKDATQSDFTPKEVPNAPSNIDTILGGIADAMSARARGMNPYVPTTDVLERLRQRREQRQATIDYNKEGANKASAAEKRARAQYELDKLDKAEADAAARSNKLEDRAYSESLATDRASPIRVDWT